MPRGVASITPQASQKIAALGSWGDVNIRVSPKKFIPKKPAMNDIGRERGWGVMSRAHFEAQRGPTGALLVDFEGGKETKSLKGKTVQDDAGLEVLIMRYDGRLLVRNDRADYIDTARVTRHDGWKTWVDKVDEAEKPAKSGKDDGFNKPGSGGDKR